MTRNLYLGADINRPLRATAGKTGVDALVAFGNANDELRDVVDATDFPVRSMLLAAEIAAASPDVVGLQEVALWRFQAQSDFTATPATDVRYDFLQLLQDQLRARGADYSVAVSQDEFDQELPADRDGRAEVKLDKQRAPKKKIGKEGKKGVDEDGALDPFENRKSKR